MTRVVDNMVFSIFEVKSGATRRTTIFSPKREIHQKKIQVFKLSYLRLRIFFFQVSIAKHFIFCRESQNCHHPKKKKMVSGRNTITLFFCSSTYRAPNERIEMHATIRWHRHSFALSISIESIHACPYRRESVPIFFELASKP